MRDITVRAWDGSKFYYFHVTQTWTDAEIEIHRRLCINGAPFEQFTGIRDRNGDDIFKGDLLRVWIEGTLQEGFYTVTSACELYFDLHNPDGYMQITKMELIGNIHENSELLKGKDK